MNVSSSTAAPAQTGKDPMKKAMDVQAQQVLTILEGLQEQSKKMTSHKTGLGNSLNVSA